MRIIADILFLIVIGYFIFQFIMILIKMNHKTILPQNKEELAHIRKHPQRPAEFSTYSAQKVGIILYALMLVFVISMFFAGSVLKQFEWSVYLLLLVPLINSRDLFDIFAVVEGGLLSGSRFIAWNRIKSYRFVPINLNHKYYGYSKEVNDGDELIIKGRFFVTSCIITSPETKDKITQILSEHVLTYEEKSN